MDKTNTKVEFLYIVVSALKNELIKSQENCKFWLQNILFEAKIGSDPYNSMYAGQGI